MKPSNAPITWNSLRVTKIQLKSNNRNQVNLSRAITLIWMENERIEEEIRALQEKRRLNPVGETNADAIDASGLSQREQVANTNTDKKKLTR